MSVSHAAKHPIANWWFRIDRVSVVLVFAILFIGCLVLLTASSAVSGKYGVDVWYFAKRQVMFLALCIPFMVMVSTLTVKRLQLLCALLVLVSIVGVFLTLFVGEGVKGATRWIHVGGFKLQPSEFLKPSLVMLTAWLFSVKEPEIFRRNFIVSLGIMALIAILLLLQPNFGMLLVLGGVWCVQVFLAGYPFMWLAGLAGVGVLVIIGAYFGLSHVQSRIDRFLDPSSGDAYQVEQGLEALMSGGFIGRGPGEGVVKHSLPDAHTDFIFAVIGEEFGLIACCLLLVLYGAFLYRSFALLLQNEDRFTLLAGTGLIVLFGAQVLINTGVVLHLLPTTGVTLPFISYGGSSTFAMAIMVGLILALTRKGERYGARHPRD